MANNQTLRANIFRAMEPLSSLAIRPLPDMLKATHNSSAPTGMVQDSPMSPSMWPSRAQATLMRAMNSPTINSAA